MNDNYIDLNWGPGISAKKWNVRLELESMVCITFSPMNDH